MVLIHRSHTLWDYDCFSSSTSCVDKPAADCPRHVAVLHKPKLQLTCRSLEELSYKAEQDVTVCCGSVSG